MVAVRTPHAVTVACPHQSAESANSLRSTKKRNACAPLHSGFALTVARALELLQRAVAVSESGPFPGQPVQDRRPEPRRVSTRPSGVERGPEQRDRGLAPGVDQMPGSAVVVAPEHERLCPERPIARCVGMVSSTGQVAARWALSPLCCQRGRQGGQGSRPVQRPARRSGRERGDLCEREEVASDRRPGPPGAGPLTSSRTP